MPTLPTVCMSYDIDGDAFVEYPVTWDLTGITTDTFATMNNIIKLNGTVSILGKIFETQASVRVAEPNVTYENVAKDRDHLTDNAFENGTKTNADGSKSYDDNLLTLTDTNRKDNNPNGLDHWSDWGHRATEQTNIKIAMDWATATTTNLIDIYYINTSTKDPTIKFEYATTSNYDEEDKFLKSSAWQTIEHTKLGDSPEQVSGSKGIRYQLSELINPQALCITFGHPTNTFIGITEIEVLQPTYTYNLNTNAALSGVTIGNDKNITFNDTTSIYSIPEDAVDISNITFENPDNAAVTILKRNDSLVKIISVSEDGQSTKNYTITANSDIPTEDEKTTFQTKLNEYKQIPSSDLKKNGYSAIQSKVQQCEENLDSMTKTDITKMQTVLETLYNRFKKSDAMKALEAKISQIKSEYKSKDYTPDSFKALQDLITEIEFKIDMLTDTEITAESVKLDTAVKNLVDDRPQSATIQTLQNKIAEYKALNSILFTENSFKQFQTLLTKVEQQLNNLSQSQLLAKIEELETAREALEPNPDAPTDTTKQNLQNKLNEYQGLDSELYIAADSYQALMNQISQIKNIIDSLTESQLQQKLSDLNTAYNNLVKASLQETVTQYKTIESWHYTAESYKTFKDLLDSIDGKIDTMTDEQRKKNLTDLAAAYTALVPDEPTEETKTKLTAKLNEYKNLDSENYTETSFKNLQDLIKEIESKINTLSETELNAKYSELEQAYQALEESEKPNPPSELKIELQNKLKEYQKIDSSLYTEESYQKLQDLIKTIESEMDSYTEDQIQTALTDLEKAYNALEKVEDPNPPKPDKNELQAKLDEYKQLDKKLFTPASYEKLQNLIKEIEGQIDDLSAEEIEAKLAELEECKEALVPDEPKTSTINTLKNRIQYCQKTYATAAYNTLKPLVTSISSTMNTLSESQLQAKLKELNTKMNGLLTKATLNRLQGKINSYSALKRTNYTTASYNTLLNLINQTKRMINTYTTEKQAASQITALDNAYKKLQKYVPPAPTLEEGDSITIGNVEYEVIDAVKRTVSATLASKKATKVTIKDTVTINNIECTVVQIPDNAFKTGAKKLKSVTIGKNIVSIGKNAFNGCKKLNKITFNNSNVKFGKKAFSKTNSKITVKVKGLKKSKRNAFKKKLTNAGMSKKVKIK